MFGNGTQKAELPLIIVCDDKDMVNANYLIQLIGQKDDSGDSIVGIEDGSVSAAIYTTKNYKDNLPQIPSTQHILFIGQSSVAKEQSKTIPDLFSKLGMHYGWLGKRAVLYVDDTAGDWLKPKGNIMDYLEFWQFSKERGMIHPDILGIGVEKFMPGTIVMATSRFGAGKTIFERKRLAGEIKSQQYKTLIKAFYEDGLRTFVEG